MKRFNIIAAIDESDQAPLVVERALDQAARHESGDLHIVRVVNMSARRAERVAFDEIRNRLLGEVQGVLEAFRGTAETAPSWRFHVHVRLGRPDEEIVELAHEARADLILIGRHGEGGRRPMFAGTTPERVLRTAPCTVMVVQDMLYDEEPVDQCPACVQLRSDSGGERWFCAEHSSEEPVHAVLGSPSGSWSLHGFGQSGLY